MPESANVPILDALLKYKKQNPVIMHMPGHKMGNGLPDALKENIASLDVTELSCTDNLHDPTGVIAEAQKLAADAFGADRTFFLVNGSSCGILAMIHTICGAGDSLIVGRDCHISVIHGLLFANVTPVFVYPRYLDRFYLPGAIAPADIEDALIRHPECKGVLLTSPNYFGICNVLPAIAEIVKKHNKILAVDEAHGAHFCFHRQMPVSAMKAGADICVQSAHKTLPAFNQGAYLHVKDNGIDIHRLRFFLKGFQTTSPSFPIMASLDAARDKMERYGSSLLEKLIQKIASFETRVHAHTDFLVLQEPACAKDQSRIVINTSKTAFTGHQAEAILREKHHIFCECVYFDNLVFITTCFDDLQHIDLLAEALECFPKQNTEADTHTQKNGDGKAAKPIEPIEAEYRKICVPERQSFLTFSEKIKNGPAEATSQKIPLEYAAGMTAGENIIPYPPGIPLVLYGEIISSFAVAQIYYFQKNGFEMIGVDCKNRIRVVK